MNTIHINNDRKIISNFELLKRFSEFVCSRSLTLVNEIGVENTLMLTLFPDAIEFAASNNREIKLTPDEAYITIKKHYKARLNHEYVINENAFIDRVISKFLNRYNGETYTMAEIIMKLCYSENYKFNYEIKYLYTTIINWLYSVNNDQNIVTAKNLVAAYNMISDDHKYRALYEYYNKNNDPKIRQMLKRYYDLCSK